MSYPRVGYVYHPEMGRHREDGGYHHERPERIYSINAAFESSGLVPLLTLVNSRGATLDELKSVHTQEYLDRIVQQLTGPYPESITNQDQDMYANEFSLDAALRATGSALNLVQEIVEDRLDTGFANVRPPGHHATPGKCMGFCFFNNVALAAVTAAKMGKRVLVVDWDIHHGNGTERIFKKINKEDQTLGQNLFFFSIHKWNNGTFYPGTGKPNIKDHFINVGFDGSRGDDYYLVKFKEILGPAANSFNPDLIIVSAGFDAAMGDPLGGCQVTPQGYHQLTKILLDICPKVAMILEGGYNLQSISTSAVACLQALLKMEYKPNKH